MPGPIIAGGSGGVMPGPIIAGGSGGAQAMPNITLPGHAP